MRFGVHVSIAGGLFKVVDRAVERGCETVQIFSGNPRSWEIDQPAEKEVIIFKQRMEQAGVYPLILHAPYLVNIGSPKFSLRLKSVLMLIESAEKAARIGASYLVFHLGSIRGSSRALAFKRTVESLEKVIEKIPPHVTLLLENMPSRQLTLGADLAEIKEMLAALSWNSRVAVCFDTCHAFTSGYDLSSENGFEMTIEEIQKTVSFERIKIIHANDSKTQPPSNRDRHQDIGLGYIGLDGFKRLLHHPLFQELPCILETPRMTSNDDLRNLEVIRSLLHS